MNMDQQYSIEENKISHNDFDDEIVAIHLETGNYYSFRATAAILWKCLAQGPASPAMLLSAFADPPADAADRITRFLADLETRGIVVEGGTGAAVAPPTIPGKAPFGELEFEAFEDLQALLVADIIHDTDDRGWPHMAPEDAAADDAADR
jgi:hypothetical protein